MALTAEDFSVLEGHKNKVVVAAFALLGTPMSLGMAKMDLDEKIRYVENMLEQMESAKKAYNP